MKNFASKFAALLLIAVTLRAAEPDAPTLFRQAETAYKQQNYSQALSLFRTFVEKYPDAKQTVRAWEYIAQCENALGDPMAAFEAYQKIWERHKDFAKLSVITRNQMKIGNYFLKNKQYDNAIKVYEKILENAPHSEVAPGAQYSLAQAYLGNEDYTAARAELSKLIRNYPSSQLVDDAMFDLGFVAYLQSKDAPYDQGATSEAIAAFRTFISNFPSSPKVPEAQQYIRMLRSRKAAALFRTAEFYENIRVPKAAQITYREVIEQYPDTPYAEEARRRLTGAERQAVKELQPPTPTSFAALTDAPNIATQPTSLTDTTPSRRVTPSADRITPITVRPASSGSRSPLAAPRRDTLRERSARRVAQLKNDPKGREALRATMKQVYTEELKRSRAAKAAALSTRRTAISLPPKTPVAQPAATTKPTTASPTTTPAAAPSTSPAVTHPSREQDELAFEIDTNEVHITIAQEEATSAPLAADQPRSAAQQSRVSPQPRMIVEYERPSQAPQNAQTTPPAVPIEGPSFDDLLAGRAQENAEPVVTPAQDWQPFADASPTHTTAAPAALTSALTSEFIVGSIEPLDSQSTTAQTSPRAAASTGPVTQRTQLPSTSLSQSTVSDERTSSAPHPAASADFIVGSIEPLSESAKPASAPITHTHPVAQARAQAAPAIDIATKPAPAQKESLATAQSRALSSSRPATQTLQPELTSRAQTTVVATSATTLTATPTSQTNQATAVTPPAESPELQRARREEQTRAALTRRRVETIREQAGRQEVNLRQITPDGRVRRAQYDEPTTAAAETPYNDEQLQREYAGIYYLIKRGDAAFQQGLASEAKQHYGNALDRLLKLKATAPTWQSDIVNYRIDYCRERLRSVQ